MSDFEQNGGETADGPDETTLLASTYLDGEATTDERALVETSPDALDAVREFEQVRTVLGATAPNAALSEREGHLAAALDVWDRMSDLERAGEVTPSDGIDAAAGAAVSTPISDARRTRERKRRPGGMTIPQWALGAAAGLVVIAGVGAVLLGVVNGDETDSSEIAVEQVAEDPASEVDALEAAEAAEVAGENVGADAQPIETNLSDDAAVADDRDDATVAADSDGLFAEEESAGEPDSAASNEAPADAPGSEQPAPAPEFPLIEIESAEDLAVYGSLVVPAIETAETAERDVDLEPVDGTCEAELGLEELLEPVLYQGVEVGVGIDLGNRVVYAYDRDDCSVVESVGLPTDTRGDDDVLTTTQP